MVAAVLRLRYLAEDPSAVAPCLERATASGWEPIELSDRARWVLIALSFPRELLPETASDERQRLRLGATVWASGEIIARIPYQHRSTIGLGLGDLRTALDRAGCSMEEHLFIDTSRGRYGLRGDGIRVDVVELLQARESPAEVDRLLDAQFDDRRRVHLADIGAGVLDAPVVETVRALLAASAARADAAVATGADADADPEVAVDTDADADAAVDPAAVGAAPDPVGRRRPRRWAAAAALVTAALIAAVVLAVDGTGRSRGVHPDGPPRWEWPGAPVAHTWTDYATAGGHAGPPMDSGHRVLITCRVRGFRVPDGDVWWYLVGSRPWSGRYYVTADNFYNDGRDSGSLKGTKLVDTRVPLCD